MKQPTVIKLFSALALAGVTFLGVLKDSPDLRAESLATYSRWLKTDTIRYMRQMHSVIENFGRYKKPDAAGTSPQENVGRNEYKNFKKAQISYNAGLVYFYEKKYREALEEFKLTQVRLEKILERMSQLYIDRTRDLMRDATNDFHPNDGKGISVMDVTVKYGKNSLKHRYLRKDRLAPSESRYYSPREAHLTYNLQKIEQNLEKGYSFIGDAVQARKKAVNIEHTLESHQKVTPKHRKKRIEWYLAAIDRCRLAKKNALNIFALKYPYQNNAHQSKKWVKKPEKVEKEEFPSDSVHYLPKNLNPVFDERIPPTYRRDAADATGYIYNGEFNHKLRGAVWKEGTWQKCTDKEQTNCTEIKPDETTATLE